MRPLTYFTLAKMWTVEKPTVAPWADQHSTWAFLYGIRAAAEAHQAFLKGQRRFPKFKPGTGTGHGSPSATDFASKPAGSGWRSTAGSRSRPRAGHTQKGSANLATKNMLGYRCGNTDAGCHLVADRDVNAAANLAAWGETQLAGRTQVGDRHPGGPSAGSCRLACGGSNEPVETLAGAPVESGTSRSRSRVA